MVRIKQEKQMTLPKMKPKPKGKNPRQKKIKKAASKKFDLFSTFLESDAGSESSKQSPSNYLDEIKNLSKPQLSALERKIQKIQESNIKLKKRTVLSAKKFTQMLRWIEDRYQCSRVQESILLRVIKKKVMKLKVLHSSPQNKYKIKNELYSSRRVIDHFFKQELEEIQEALDQGLLLRPHQRHGPYSMLKTWIDQCIKKID